MFFNWATSFSQKFLFYGRVMKEDFLCTFMHPRIDPFILAVILSIGKFVVTRSVLNFFTHLGQYNFTVDKNNVITCVLL